MLSVTIRLFPALPPEWKDVEFHDLRTEGAFLVSAKRVGGKTEWVTIKSLTGEPCRIKPGFDGRIRLTDFPPNNLKRLSEGIYEVSLSKGEKLFLAPAHP